MANQHFAKFADIWKHLPLVEVLRLDQPRRYWETHAGSGSYPLTHSPERDFGVYWFLPRALNSELADSRYVEVLSLKAGPDQMPLRYPGSAMFAMLTLGRNAHDYLLCDLDPHSAADLRRAVQRMEVVDLMRVLELDGPSAIEREWSRLPSSEIASTLCFIDPFDPFDAAPGAMSAVELLNALSAAGLNVVYWYGYEEPEDAMWPLSHLGDGTSAWCGDMLLPERDESGLIGCGVVLANVSQDAIHRCEELGLAVERLYRDASLPSGARGSVQFSKVTTL
jgi:23S rRNA A2030 N6-methylase RlmJ